jgi:hypothetical protein
MGNTQAKLAPILEQAESRTRDNTLKRGASLTSLDPSTKRRAHALQSSDSSHSHDILPHSSCMDTKLREEVRDSLDGDEQFQELPQLFDQVYLVANKYGHDDTLLHRNCRGQDAPSCLRNKTGKWNILMSSVRSFRPVTVTARSSPVGHGKEGKQELLVFGGDEEEGPQWLTVSYHIDTQLPHLVLRISKPSTGDAQGKSEHVFVKIFATNLIRGSTKSKAPMRMVTGQLVALGRKHMKRLASARPRLVRKVKEGHMTQTSLKLNRVSKGQTDVEGRSNRPVIVGNLSRMELDKMTTDVLDRRPDQTAHEKLLGLIHGDLIDGELVLYSEYDRNNDTREFAWEVNLCKFFSLAMILCNELGNFWAYRLQFPDICWTDANFPFNELLPPRWTIRKWFMRADNAGDGQAIVSASPAQWQAINRPRTFPGAEEELFFRGLNAVEDDPSSMRVLVRKEFKHDSEGQTSIPRSA